MTTPLLHPRAIPGLKRAGFFRSTCAILGKLEPAPLNDLGQPIDTYVALVAWAAIPCIKAPLSANERQAAQYTATDQAWFVLLDGYYPGITTAHRAVVDGESFDIDAVEHDQTGNLTRLRVRSVEV